MITLEDIKESCHNWLQQEVVFGQEGDYYCISLPFIDNDQDLINIYLKQNNQSDDLLLTDLGITINNLDNLGIQYNRKGTLANRLFEGALKLFNVTKSSDDCLEINSSMATLAHDLNDLIQCILSLNDLEYLVEGEGDSRLLQKAKAYFQKSGILYTTDLSIASAEKITAHFDFSIPGTKLPERLIQVMDDDKSLNHAKRFNYDVKMISKERQARYILLVNEKAVSLLKQVALQDLPDGLAKVMSLAELEENNSVVQNL